MGNHPVEQGQDRLARTILATPNHLTERLKPNPSINEDVLKAIFTVWDYLAWDEQKDFESFEESERPNDHIYLSLRTISDWLDEIGYKPTTETEAKAGKDAES